MRQFYWPMPEWDHHCVFCGSPILAGSDYVLTVNRDNPLRDDWWHWRCRQGYVQVWPDETEPAHPDRAMAHHHRDPI